MSGKGDQRVPTAYKLRVMQSPGRPSPRFDRSSGLLLGYIFTMFGLGMVLMGANKRDLLFPVGGGFFVLSGIALALLGLAQPRLPSKPREPVSRFGIFFRAAFILLFAGLVFLCADFGPRFRWTTPVGLLLSTPYVIACIVFIAWILPRELRSSRAARAHSDDDATAPDPVSEKE